MIEELKNSKPNILVVGDLILDTYLWGKCNRISPEAPVQIVDVDNESSVPGGAGNVIRNLVSFGAKVFAVSVIGNDDASKEILGYFEDNNVDSACVVKDVARKTTKKTRIMSSGQQILRFDCEDRHDITSEQEEVILERVSLVLQKMDIVVLSDYGKGVLTKKLISSIIDLAKSAKVKVLVDPKHEDFSKYKGAYLLTPNTKEASAAVNLEIVDEASLLAAHEAIKSIVCTDQSLITLSEQGISLYCEEHLKIGTVAKEVCDVTGAGDTVISAIAFALCSGVSLVDAVRFSNYAAGVVVGKIGSSVASFSDIEAYIACSNAVSSAAVIKTRAEIVRLAEKAKHAGKKIVFTNGCFDIVHAGHVSYLEEAKSFGDLLIVGVNSDASVSRLKGPTRPVNSCEDRGRVLAALQSVDYVVQFEEDTPYRLIKEIGPSVLVKGGDYLVESVVGADIVGEVKIVDFMNNKSTSNIITKIQGAGN